MPTIQRPKAGGAPTTVNDWLAALGHRTAQAGPDLQGAWRQVQGAVGRGVDQGNVALRGISNVVSSGKADSLNAGADTLFNGGLDQWRQRYRANLAREQALDRLDQARHPKAYQAGVSGAQGADAAVRGAANMLTFGAADHLAAAGNTISHGRVDHLAQRYVANLALEHARDRQAQATHPLAYGGGQVAGVALGLGKVGAAAKALPRIPGAVRLGAGELARLSAAGAAGNTATQILTDDVTGHRSSLGDYAGGALGGAVSAPLTPFLRTRAPAIGGAVTSVAQDVFNGRPISWEQAAQAAMAAHVLGAYASGRARAASNALTPSEKGKLGEALGAARSELIGKPRLPGKKVRDYLPDGRYWVPDGRDGEKLFEDKFGYRADTSTNQKYAQQVLPNFHLNHFLPEDIGAAASLPASFLGAKAVLDAKHPSSIYDFGPTRGASNNPALRRVYQGPQ